MRVIEPPLRLAHRERDLLALLVNEVEVIRNPEDHYVVKPLCHRTDNPRSFGFAMPHWSI